MKLRHGAAYYPEIWDPKNVKEDIEKMKLLGLNTMRIGEFAWSSMEPTEGNFDFSWMLSVMDQLYDAGIDVVLCTPSATPPQWLVNKYPECLQMLSDGSRVHHGGRKHTCHNSSVYREKCAIITEEMCKALVGHPSVVGWQLDNEPYPYHDGCFCPICTKAFQKYLQNKFGTVENLNKAWDMCRWSLSYESFETVEPPMANTWHHPSLLYAWMCATSDAIVENLNRQADIIRRYFDCPIGTDMMPMSLLNYTDVHKNLDLVQFNHYNGKEFMGEETSFWYDFIRPIKDAPFWVTETRACWSGGTAAAGGYAPIGFSYANAILPFFRGGSCNMYWLFKTNPSGHELIHGAVLDSAGRLTYTAEDTKRVSDTLAKGKDFFSQGIKKAKLAIHYGQHAYTAFRYASLAEGFQYESFIRNSAHAAARRDNIAVDVIDTYADLSDYDVVVSPMLCMMEEYDFKNRIKAWVENGGTWIVGPFSDFYDENMRRHTDSPSAFLEELAGVYIKWQIPLPDARFSVSWENDTADFVGQYFYEVLEAKDASVLASYKDQPGVAMTERKVGKGKVIFVGTGLTNREYSYLYRKCGLLPAAESSENVQVVAHHAGLAVLEVKGAAGYVMLEKPYRDILSGQSYSGKIALAAYESMLLVQE